MNNTKFDKFTALTANPVDMARLLTEYSANGWLVYDLTTMQDKTSKPLSVAYLIKNAYRDELDMRRTDGASTDGR